MNDAHIVNPPAILAAIDRDTRALGFGMASETRTGNFLRALAASKPGGGMLELGTGTGVGTAWLLAGMDAHAHLDSVDNDVSTQQIARRHLGTDPRVTFHHADGAAFVSMQAPNTFDLIFADSWPGKFSVLDQTLSLLRTGGIYVVDDLLPQPNWPPGHDANVPPLVSRLERSANAVTAQLAWSSGLMVLVRTNPQSAILNPQSSIRNPQSSILNPQSKMSS
jgi:predicted O-methyltransferase YrrM